MIQVFGGKGFAGSHFSELFSKDTLIINERGDYSVSDKADQIIYFISTISNYNVLVDPYLDIETNLITLIKVLEQVKGKNITFNFISSWFVYGKTSMPAKEESVCNPKGFYSITKRSAEQLLISYCETFEINYRIFRMANLIGSYDPKASPKKNALQFMINELKKGKDISIYDGGELFRDYIHVKDGMNAVKLVMNSGDLNDIFNISNGIPIKLKDILELACSFIPNHGKLISIDTPKFHKNVQVKSMWMDNSKIKSIGYIQKYSLKEMIKEMVSL